MEFQSISSFAEDILAVALSQLPSPLPPQWRVLQFSAINFDPIMMEFVLAFALGGSLVIPGEGSSYVPLNATYN